MIKLPQNNKWTQTNTSDVLGSLWASKGIDLTKNAGRINISPRTFINLDSGDSANLGLPVAIKKFDAGTGNGDIWAIAGARMFKINATSPYLNTTFEQDAITSTPTSLNVEKADLAVFADYLVVSNFSNTMYRLSAAGAWSTVTPSGSPTKLETYGERLYYATNSNQIRSCSTAFSFASSGQYTLTIESDEGSASNYITDIKAGTNRIWIATVNQNGGRGSIYEWDGTSSTYSKRYYLEAEGAVALCIKDDVPYAMDSRGRLLVWNGGSFKVIAKLKEGNEMFIGSIASAQDDRYVAPNGMAVIEDNINILINSKLDDDAGTTMERVPSGIYEYTPENGLYLKYGIANYIDGSSTDAFGISRTVQVGALEPISTASPGSSANGTFLYGISFKDATNTTQYAVCFDDSRLTEKRAGYFITNKLESAQVTDEWQRLFIVHKPLSGSDKIVAKYRTTESAPTTATVTWSTGTTFTTTTNLSNYVGYEVEFLTGIGSGTCAHIVSVTGSGTYTVTIDETVGGYAGTATIQVQNWTKLEAGESTESYQGYGLPTGTQSTWIQFKVWGRGTGDLEIHRVLLQHTPFITAS